VTVTLQGAGSLVWGNIFDVNPTGSNPVGTPSVQIFGGSIVDNLKGFLFIGPTDAASIDAHLGGGLVMEAPDTFLGAFFSVTGSSGSTIDNILQGSLGPLDDFSTNTHGGFEDALTATVTTMVGGHDAGDLFETTGGTTNITLNNPSGGDVIGINQIALTEINTSQGVRYGDESLAITEDNGDFNTEGTHLTTITHFVVVGSNPGVNDDIVTFSVDSWGGGSSNGFGGTYDGLVQGDGTSVSELTFANMFLVGSSGTTLAANTDVVVYEQNGFAGGLTALVNAIQTSGGAFKVGFTAGTGDTFDMLIAYNNGAGGVNISDIQFEQENGDTSTQFLDIVASHNLVTLNNITGGVGSLYSEYLAHHSNIFFTS
jgi:hypothetical protein